MQPKFLYLQSLAHNMVARALFYGDLVRPDRCTKCGVEHPKLHAHHEDYSKPLEVIWLCPSCHRIEHSDKIDKVEYPARILSRTSPKLDDIVMWLRAHPDKENDSCRSIAEILGDVSHMTVLKAQRILREEKK